MEIKFVKQNLTPPHVWSGYGGHIAHMPPIILPLKARNHYFVNWDKQIRKVMESSTFTFERKNMKESSRSIKFFIYFIIFEGATAITNVA